MTTLAVSLPGRADTILSLPASGPLPQDMWKVSNGSDVTMTDGILHIMGDAQNPGAYSVNFIYNADPLPLLNFLHNTVVIKIANLDIKGDAPPANQVFCLFLINDKPLETPDSSLLKVRLSADGTLSASMNAPGANNSQSLWQATVILPVKSLTITLTAAGLKFALEDGSGPKSQESPWGPGLQTVAWDGASPYLRIQGQRNPGAGSADISIGSLSADSTPADAAAK